MPRHAAPTWLPVRASPWPRRFRRGRIARGWLSFAKVSSAGVLRNHTPPCRPPVQPACRACHPRVRDLCLSSPQWLEEDGEPGALGARSGLARCVRGSRGTKRLVRLPIRIRHSRGGPRHSASGAPRASSAFTAPPCPPPQPGLCVLRPWCGASLWLLRPRSSLGVSLVLVTLSITFDQTSPPASNAVRAFSLHRAESQMK